MKRLRLRIAAILIGAIVFVVLVATVVAIFVTDRANPDRMVWPVASQIMTLETFYGQRGLGNHLGANIENLGPERVDLTAALRERLAMGNLDYPVTVYDRANGDTQIAVVEIADRKLAIEFPTNMPLPKEIWLLLSGWLGLIVIGVIGVSLLMAYRVTRPFVMLEDAVNSVGGDGFLPHIPERGSGEARHTASVLNRLSERLRYAMESRMRLVAAAGHDLRTPMTRMRIRAEFLSEEDRIAWSRDIDELELIADSAIRLVKEEVGGNDATPVALHILLRDAVGELQAQNYAIDLGTVQSATLALPPLATKRALRNLLINAATHGKGGCVSLSTTPHSVIIEICDNGPGIPRELLSQVFEPFFRAQPGRIQTVPGAGLGLAIAKEIIERSGGSLIIANGETGGLVQTLSFPRQGTQP